MGRVYEVKSAYVLDTHILMWALNADPRLIDAHRHIFMRGDDVVVSAITILEIAIKKSLGKIVLAFDIVELLRDHGIPILPVDERHAARVEHLPLYHRDPFDRVLIAQAQVEGLTLVTSDSEIARYDVSRA